MQDVPFTNTEDDDTGQDYLCPRTRAAISPIVTRPSTLWTYHDRWSCYLLYLQGRWELCPCTAMSGDEGDAASGCAVCSGSRFLSSVPSVPHDGCPICVCRQGLYHEAHSLPDTDIVHATNNVVEVVCDTTSPGCYSHPFQDIPHFTMERAESIRRSLPLYAWVTSIDLVDTYFHIPIHRGYRKCLRFQTRETIYQFRALPFGLFPAPWVFS